VGRWNITQIFGQRKCSTGEPNYMCWHENAGVKTGGMWYSTTSIGYNVTWKVCSMIATDSCNSDTSSALNSDRSGDNLTCYGVTGQQSPQTDLKILP
jgi:hypothetical protein